MAVPGFRQQHEQMQTWLLWMIDGASYIDPDDERWEFLTIYEKTGSEASATNGSSAHLNGSAAGSRYHFVGYCTVYRYFAYPDKLRPRISQFLILPPFQRQGLGAHLLQSLYDRYRGQESVVDIAVEDPAENFSKLRDFVDTRNCMSLPEFSSENIAKGWSNEMAQSAQSKLKLNRIQVRRVYEILKLKSIDRKDEDAFRAYRLEVKNRLNAPFLKNKFTDANPVTDEVRMTSLQNMFDEAVLEYDETIQKLDAMS
jgi:histone acetyltransferase 1